LEKYSAVQQLNPLFPSPDVYGVCLLNSRKTSIKIKQLKIEPRSFLAFFSVGPRDVDLFFTALSLPPERLGDVRRYAIFLLGGLLIEAEASQLAFRPWLTHQQ
jgi:hypothetical protein